MPYIDKDVQKAVLKEALKEWLDEQFARLGRWTFYGVVAMAFAGVVYVFLTSTGWVKK